jgi:DNA-binding CsgD family transcriptional regulator
MKNDWMSSDPISAIRPKRKSRAKQHDVWKKLEEDLAHLRPDFLRTLISNCPSLTKREQLVCALIRMNMQSWQIAEVLATSEENVNNHRYNIRRKLGLREKHKHDLANFLSTL